MERLTALCLLLVLSLLAGTPTGAGGDDTAAPRESESTTRIELENGTYYFLHLPKGFVDDGSWGLMLLLHGQCGDVPGILNTYLHGSNGGNFLEQHRFIGVVPRSKGELWSRMESTPMLAVLDAMTRVKVNRDRVHVAGTSAGGFFAGWLGYERPDIFKSVTVIAASLALADKDKVKKFPGRQVFFFVGETDINRKAAEDDFKKLQKAGNRFARLFVRAGDGHQVKFWNDFDMLARYYTAIESGYDYPGQLEKARKQLITNLESSVSLIREIGTQPREDVFFEELGVIKNIANRKAEAKLAELMKQFGARPSVLESKLLEFEKLYSGLPVADDAQKHRQAILSDANTSRKGD